MRRQKTGIITVLACAAALALSTTQCRKNVEDITAMEGETITISISGSNGAGRADINVDNGLITWNVLDRIYVVCEDAYYGDDENSTGPVLLGGYLRAMTISGYVAYITGQVSVPAGYHLRLYPNFRFYYVGDGVELTKTSSGPLVFDISNQYQKWSEEENAAVAINDAGEYMVGRTEEPVEMVREWTSPIEFYFRPKDAPAMPRTFSPLTAVLRLNASQLGTSGDNVRLHGDKVYNKMTINLSNPMLPSYTKGDITFKVGTDARISIMPAVCDSPAPNDTVNLNFSCGTGASLKWGRIGIKNGIEAGRIYVDVVSHTSNPINVPLYYYAIGTASPFNGGGWDDGNTGTASQFDGGEWGNP